MSTASLSAHERMLLLSIAAGHKAAGKQQRAWAVEKITFISDNNTPEEKAAAIKHARRIISINRK